MPDIQLLIQNAGVTYKPDVKDEITWETERQGAPGKLTFSVRKDPTLNFQEGNPVTLRVDGKNVFYGFVFTKKRNKDGLIGVTAYDQLRYLKNKDVLQYSNLTASAVVKMLADKFELQAGELEDTGYTIPKRTEDNKTLFDVILSALDETLTVTKKLYVLYDDFGKLTLKNIASLKLDVLINQNAAEDFDYSSSIDNETYNQIKLIYENDKTSKRETYLVKDSASISRWGVLQYFEKLKDPANGPGKANAMLAMYNKKSRNLSIKKAFGDIRVRGGFSVPVTLDLGDVVANTYMVVEKAKHTISGDTHYMDLTLRGGDFT